jgi:hypothetical protein
MKSKNDNRDNGTFSEKLNIETMKPEMGEGTGGEKAQMKITVTVKKGQQTEETPEGWWASLSAAEKRFAYDLHDLARGLIEGGVVEVKTGLDVAKRKLRAACQRLAVAYDSAGVQSPGGGPERWRWN